MQIALSLKKRMSVNLNFIWLWFYLLELIIVSVGDYTVWIWSRNPSWRAIELKKWCKAATRNGCHYHLKPYLPSRITSHCFPALLNICHKHSISWCTNQISARKMWEEMGVIPWFDLCRVLKLLGCDAVLMAFRGIDSQSDSLPAVNGSRGWQLWADIRAPTWQLSSSLCLLMSYHVKLRISCSTIKLPAQHIE